MINAHYPAKVFWNRNLNLKFKIEETIFFAKVALKLVFIVFILFIYEVIFRELNVATSQNNNSSNAVQSFKVYKVKNGIKLSS